MRLVVYPSYARQDEPISLTSAAGACALPSVAARILDRTRRGAENDSRGSSEEGSPLFCPLVYPSVRLGAALESMRLTLGRGNSASSSGGARPSPADVLPYGRAV